MEGGNARNKKMKEGREEDREAGGVRKEGKEGK